MENNTSQSPIVTTKFLTIIVGIFCDRCDSVCSTIYNINNNDNIM